MYKCPICTEEFDYSLYIKKGICSNCGGKVCLKESEYNNIIRSTTKKSNLTMSHSSLPSAQNLSSSKTIAMVKSTSRYKKTNGVENDNNSSIEKKECQNAVNQNMSASIESDFSESIELKTDLGSNECSRNSSLVNKDSSINNKDFSSTDNIKENQKSAKQIFGNSGYKLSNYAKLVLSLVKKKAAEKNHEKKELLDSDLDFPFNSNGFYDDTEASEPAAPDFVPIKTVAKIAGVLLALLFGTIFIIYYK